MLPGVLLSAHECWLWRCTILMSAFDWSWLPMSTQECSWPLIIANECSWAPMNTYLHGPMVPWTLMSTDERSWALLSAHRQSWPIKRTHEDGAASQSALMSTQEHSWQHGNINFTAPECQQVIMSDSPSSDIVSSNSERVTINWEKFLVSLSNDSCCSWVLSLNSLYLKRTKYNSF